MSIKATASSEAVGRIKQAGSTSAQKVGERVTSSWESVKARLADAISAFSNRLDLELETQRLAREKKIARPRRMHESAVLGLLVSTERREAVPVYEGSNGFRVDEKGIPFRASLQNAYGNATAAQVLVRVTNGFLEVSDHGKESRRYTTNDFVTLGNQKYLLKLFPREYQAERAFYMEDGR